MGLDAAAALESANARLEARVCGGVLHCSLITMLASIKMVWSLRVRVPSNVMLTPNSSLSPYDPILFYLLY